MAFFVGLQTTSDNEAATDYSIENGIEIYNKSIGVFQKEGLVEEEVSSALGHEFFHTLGVYHTHKDTRETEEGKIVYPNKKYVFARNYTTNLMSYTDLLAPYPCYSTWCWQWAIVNPAIKIEIENEKRR